MANIGVYLAFDVDYISMIPTGGELVACRHSVKVDDEDLAGAYELIRKLYQEVRIERYNLKQENAKLREQVTQLRDDWESERDYADQMEAKEKRAVAENEKLRELARKWYPHMLKRVGRDALEQWGQMDVVKELGIEV